MAVGGTIGTMLEVIKRYLCLCEECRHLWLALEVPERCAKCKARTWNASGVLPVGEVSVEVEQSLARLGTGEAAAPTKALRELMSPERTPEEMERTKRKKKKEARHRELKEDSRAALEADTPAPAKAKLAAKMKTPASDHHPACRCYRCRPPSPPATP